MAWLTLKRGLIIAVVLVLIPVAWAAWWLGSPLFIDKTVEEEFPLAFSAVVPEGMKRSEVEKVMETMAKVDSPREEPMGEVMAVAVALKKGEFRGVGHRGEGDVLGLRVAQPQQAQPDRRCEERGREGDNPPSGGEGRCLPRKLRARGDR